MRKRLLLLVCTIMCFLACTQFSAAQLVNWEVRNTTGDYDEAIGQPSCYLYPMQYTGTWRGYLECIGAPACYAGLAVNTLQNLGNFCYRSRVDANANLRGSYGWYGGATQEYTLLCRRNYQAAYANQPIAPVGLQLYYTRAEVDNLIASFNARYGTAKTYSDLVILKYSGSNQDLDPLNNSGTNSDYQQIVPSTTFYGSTSQFMYAEFSVTSYSEFYLALTHAPRKLYVNDGATTGDIFTTGIGGNVNNGSPSQPFATINYALSQAIKGDTIILDAGTYPEQVIVEKSINVRGAGAGLTIIKRPLTNLVVVPGSAQRGVIVTLADIGNLSLKNLTIESAGNATSSNNGFCLVTQTGGEISGCHLKGGSLGDGMYATNSGLTPITISVSDNNFTNIFFSGINFQGAKISATVTNNSIDVTGSPYGMGILGGGEPIAIEHLTATNNIIKGFNGFGIKLTCNNPGVVISNNSFESIASWQPVPSIQNNSATAVNAVCNWFGTADAEVVKASNAGNVNYAPWLVRGTDTQPLSNGFQPEAGTCTGRQNKFYVNDDSQTGDVLTSAVGNNANNGFSSAPMATITHAISIAQPGDTIIVDAGRYAERIYVNKPLSLRGAYRNSNPGNLLSRGSSESILVPAMDDNLLEIVTVQAANVSFDGFTFDGDNPLIPGTVTLNGVDVNGGMAIYNGNMATDNLVVKNNIIKNFLRYGLLLQKNTGPVVGNLITANHVDNVSSRLPRDGRAIGLFANSYGTVSNNFLTRVNTGVIIANYNAGATDSVLIAGNTIEFYSYGINSSNHTNLTSSFLIEDNTISVANLATWNAPGSLPNNFTTGIAMSSATGTKDLLLKNNSSSGANYGIRINFFTGQGKVVLTDNVLSGNQTGLQMSAITTSNPVQVNGGLISNSSLVGFMYADGGTTNTNLKLTNASFLNNVVGIDVSAGTGSVQTEFEGVTITGGTTGIRFYGTQLSLPNDALTGVGFANQSKEYILQTSNAFQGKTIDASTAVFDGLTPTQMSLSQLFATEDKLTHRIDFDNVGYFKLKPSQVFVTKNSFAATLPPVFGTPTTTPNINRAIGAAAPGDIVHIGEGVYANQVLIDKALTLKGAGIGLTTIQMPPLPHVAAFTAPPFGSEYGVVQTTENISGDVNIEQLTVDGVNQTFANNAHGIIIQTSGRVAGCEVKNMRNPIQDRTYLSGNGIFGRYNGTAPKALTFEGNKVSGFHYNGLLAFGSALNVNIINNEIDGTGGLSSMNITTNGLNGGVQSLNIAHNTISGFTGYGIGIAGNTAAVINNNSIIGTGNFAINNQGSAPFNASCNWFGTSNWPGISSKINGVVNFVPWLTNGTDADAAIGFQPAASACNGTIVVASIDLVTAVSCRDAANGAIEVSITNGQAPFNYAWSKDDVPGFSSLQDLTSLAPGSYTLVVTDANGTASTVSADISEPDALVATATGSNNICFGGTSGTADVSATGGTQPYSYLWSNAASIDNISNLTAGVYTVTITDANGCTAVASYTVTQPTQILATATGISTACSNSATVTAIGGTGTLSYLWSNGATTTTLNNIASGTYSVTVSDENQCTAVASVTVTGSEAFNPSVQVTNVNCFGSLTGILTVTNVNGQSPFSYSIDGINYQNSNVFTGLAAGIYTVSVVDANGCAGFVTKTISQPSALTITLNNVQPTCGGSATGAIAVTAAGGSGGYSYNWTGLSFSSTQRNIVNLSAGTYTLTVTDNAGCTANVVATVTSFETVVVTAVVNNIRCKAETNGSIDLTLTGGTGQGFTYAWTNGAISQDLVNLGVGNFNVIITDIGSGCTVTKSYTITQPASLVSISTTKTNATGCQTLGSITITGSGGTAPYTYSKDGLNFAGSNIFNNLYAGSYTVWIKDNNGCTRSTVVAITDNGSDQYESNNSKGQAKLIALGTAIYARLAIANDAMDWFKITTPTGGAPYTMAISHENIAYNINLYAAGNNTPALTPIDSTSGSKTYNLTGGTTYYISVAGALSYKCYTLSISPVLFSKTGLGSQPQTVVTNEPLTVSETLESVVFPNPHRGNFSIQIKSPENGMTTVKLFSTTGQQLAQKNVTIKKGTVNLVPFSAVKGGTIFYRVEQGKLVATGKIIGTN